MNVEQTVRFTGRRFVDWYFVLLQQCSTLCKGQVDELNVCFVLVAIHTQFYFVVNQAINNALTSINYRSLLLLQVIIGEEILRQNLAQVKPQLNLFPTSRDD